MCTIARTSREVFKAYIDLSPTEQAKFWEAVNLAKRDEENRTHKAAMDECRASYRAKLESCHAEIDGLKKAHNVLELERDKLREKVRKLKRLQGKRPAYKRRQTKRILRLIDEKGKSVDEVADREGMTIAAVMQRYYRAKRSNT